MTEKARGEFIVDSGLDNINVRILESNKGNWRLQLFAHTAEGKRILDKMSVELGYYRTHPHILILSQLSTIHTSTMYILDFSVDEGPDIVGIKEEIKELQNWKPAEKTKKPLAHEVILRKLRALQKKYDEVKQKIDEAIELGGMAVGRCEDYWIEQSYLCAQAVGLIEILTAIPIPKAERKEMVEALRLLPSSFFPPMAIDIFEAIENNE